MPSPDPPPGTRDSKVVVGVVVAAAVTVLALVAIGGWFAYERVAAGFRDPVSTLAASPAQTEPAPAGP